LRNDSIINHCGTRVIEDVEENEGTDDQENYLVLLDSREPEKEGASGVDVVPKICSKRGISRGIKKKYM